MPRLASDGDGGKAAGLSAGRGARQRPRVVVVLLEAGNGRQARTDARVMLLLLVGMAPSDGRGLPPCGLLPPSEGRGLLLLLAELAQGVVDLVEGQVDVLRKAQQSGARSKGQAAH
jgi:hypothetical protein